MARIIIGIHGLRNKPPRRLLQKWWKKAIREGLRRHGYSRRCFRFRLVYWADLLYPRPLDRREKDPKSPFYLEDPYRPAPEVDVTTRREMRRRVLDSLEKVVDSVFTARDGSARFNALSDSFIRERFPDLDCYYHRSLETKPGVTRPAKEVIRERLARQLRRFRRRHIMLIGHSMGSIVAFDVLNQVIPGIVVDTLVTIGSPLALPAIKGKIKAEKPLQVPENVRRWFNLSDLKDMVAVNYNLADDFQPSSTGVAVVDQTVCNEYCWSEIPDPHKSFGYLQTPQFADICRDFFRR